jgi:hypothetical protein
LFNFYIDDLVRKGEQLQGVLTYGHKTSILVFADDVALVANSPLDLQKSVNAAHEWAISNGMTFSLSKCMYLGHKGIAPKLGSTNITRCDRATYLGMSFVNPSLDFKFSNEKRTKNARLRSDMLRSSGFKIMGFKLDASVAVYKTFVRPMVEYGLALTPKAMLKPIQRAQEHGLRTMFSSTRHTSRAALQLLTRITPMRDRQLLLQASFFGKLHNSGDA